MAYQQNLDADFNYKLVKGGSNEQKPAGTSNVCSRPMIRDPLQAPNRKKATLLSSYSYTVILASSQNENDRTEPLKKLYCSA